VRRDAAVHASYVVRTEVFADPSLPPVTGDELAGFDFDAALEQIAQEAAGLTADDLQDGVYRRFEHRLCPRCSGGSWPTRSASRGSCGRRRTDPGGVVRTRPAR
jgi:ribosomal protein S27AE